MPGRAGVTPHHRARSRGRHSSRRSGSACWVTSQAACAPAAPASRRPGHPYPADNLSQPRPVLPVNRLYDRVPFRHAVSGPHRRAGGLIPPGAFQELAAQFLIYPHHHPGPPTTSARSDDRRVHARARIGSPGGPGTPPYQPCLSVQAARAETTSKRQIGGYARGYHELFASLAAWQIPLQARWSVRQAVCLCIVALVANVLIWLICL